MVGTELIGNGLCDDASNNQDCNYDGGECCVNPDVIGNGVCNDQTNNVNCNYDGGDCPDIILNGTVYFFNHLAQSYDDAETKCQQEFGGNGKLFEPQSVEHMNSVIDVARNNFGWTHVWLGINDSSNEGTYVYASSGLEIPLSIDNAIIVANGCDAKDCDLLYKSTQIFTVWNGIEVKFNSVCEPNT